VVLKPGWLNRQFDQVARDVDEWPEWMKRAAGVTEQVCTSRDENSEAVKAEPSKTVQTAHQQKLL
jgi:hypothetical protein